MSDLKPGDVVTLNSGGPKMTIIDVDEGSALVAWFDKAHDLLSIRVDLIALQPASGAANYIEFL